MHFLYITENFDWVHKNKYGYTLDLCRINDSHEQHSYLSNYKKIYQIEKTNSYKLYNETDKIFSIIVRDESKIKYLEKIYNYSFPLLYQFNEYLVNDKGSTEFMYKNGINLFEKIITNYFPIFGLNINKIYNEDEINEINNTNKKKINNMKQLFCELFENSVIPLPHQQEVLDMIENFYKNYNICRVCWSCGLGKTLLAIFIIKKLNFKINLIGVPRTFLLSQFQDDILLIFPNRENILFVGGKDFKSTTNDNIIKLFLQKKTNEPKFIITTYKSCNLLLNYEFDFKVGDEAHRLIGIDDDKVMSYNLFHKIKSKKTLFMTATEKIIDNDLSKTCYSMDDENIFGMMIDNKTVHWAIENKKITDYNLILLKNSEDEINYIINKINIAIENKELFISAFMVVKALVNYDDLTHLLIYTNSTENADILEKYINTILDKNIFGINIYNKSLHSKNCSNIEEEIKIFKKSKFGIISCVYIFGEGFNCPILNGVAVAENMESENRIVQSILRPTRLNKEKPNKKAYILLRFDENNFDTCKQIIYKLRNVDKKVEQKIDLVISKKSEKIKADYIPTNYNFELVSNIFELNKIILRLKYSKTLYSNFSEEEDEYNYVVSINKELNLSSYKDYIKSELKHINYVKNPEEYFKEKGVWKNLYHFLGFDTNIFITAGTILNGTIFIN
jgi:predicted helicase